MKVEMRKDGIYICFQNYYNGKEVLTVKIKDNMSLNFIGKYKFKESIYSAIKEENLQKLIRNLEFENRAGVEAYYYLLGYLQAINL